MSEDNFYEVEMNYSVGISLAELLEYYRNLCEQ